MQSGPNLSIIIVSYNTKGLLDQCVRSILASPAGSECEIIVVDNASGDGSVELLRETYPTIRVVANRQNVGFARANNQGLEIAQGRYGLFLNSDTEIVGGALETMCRYLDEHPEAGILGPQLLNSDASLQPSGNRIPSLGKEILRALPRRSAGSAFFDAKRDYTATAEVEEVSGACLLTRRVVWEGIGPLDENFFFYFEDVDFCRRAGRAGWKVIYLPSARVLHHWGGSSKQMDPVFAAKCLSGYFYWIRKAHGGFGEAMLRVLIAAVSTGKLLIGSAGAAFGSARGRRLLVVNGFLVRVCLGWKP